MHPQNLPPVAMATSGYSEDLQPQQANTVTIATSAATPPSATKAAHFLSEIAPAAGSIVSANQSATASKTGLAGQNPNQNQKAVVLTSSASHYVTPDIQNAAAQKSNGQSSSPQYIIVTVTGEGGASWRLTHTCTRKVTLKLHCESQLYCSCEQQAECYELVFGPYLRD